MVFQTRPPLQNLSHHARSVPGVHQGQIVVPFAYDSQGGQRLPGRLEEAQKGVFPVTVGDPAAHHVRGNARLAPQRQHLRLDGLPFLELHCRHPAYVVLRPQRPWPQLGRRWLRWLRVHHSLGHRILGRRWLRGCRRSWRRRCSGFAFRLGSPCRWWLCFRLLRLYRRVGSGWLHWRRLFDNLLVLALCPRPDADGRYEDEDNVLSQLRRVERLQHQLQLLQVRVV
mmetsp:Transcript_26872/g.70294  ORF Transcript_26872/g.70294 Transcript_26872/m.70294 type:complete len:226 (-) Transcript_26872:285-962(-)